MKRLITLLFICFGLSTFAQTNWTNMVGAQQSKDSTGGKVIRFRFSNGIYLPIVTPVSLGDSLKNYAQIQDGLVSGGTATIGTGSVTIAIANYRINKLSYTSASRTFTGIANSPSGTQYYLVVYGKTSSTLDTISGARANVAIVPNNPVNTVRINTILIGDAGISSSYPDLSGYALKDLSNVNLPNARTNLDVYSKSESIRNGTAQQPSSNFNIFGSGTFGGNATVGQSFAVTGASTLTGNTTLSGNLALTTGGAGFDGMNLIRNLSSSGSASVNVLRLEPTYQSDVTSQAFGVRIQPATVAGSYTIGLLSMYDASFKAKGTGSTITDLYGFRVTSGNTAGTNNYAFAGQIPSGTGRWNAYMIGTASNYFNGTTLFGTTTDNGVDKLQVSGSESISGNSTIGGNLAVTGTSTLTGNTRVNGNIGINASPVVAQGIDIRSTIGGGSSYGIYNGVTFNNSTTTNARGFGTNLILASGNTTGNVEHYQAQQGTFNSVVPARQSGFYVMNNLIGATVNYGFEGAIPSGTGRWNAYMSGTASNYFNGTTLFGTTSDNGVDKVQIVGSASVSTRFGIGSTSSSTFLNLPSGTTTSSSLRIPASVAPTTPIDGDIWRLTGRTQLYDGTVTKDVLFDKANSVFADGIVGAIVSDGAGNFSKAPIADRVISGILTTKTAAYTVTLSDVGSNGTVLVRGDATTAAFTITLPVASTTTGLTFIIKKIDSSANGVTVSVASTIDGVSTKVFNTQYSGASIMSNGTNYNIVGTF